MWCYSNNTQQINSAFFDDLDFKECTSKGIVLFVMFYLKLKKKITAQVERLYKTHPTILTMHVAWSEFTCQMKTNLTICFLHTVTTDIVSYPI